MAQTNEELIAALNKLVAEGKGDSFRVRVFRRRSQGSLPEAVCTLGDAQVIHIAAPETWLPRLCGGGPIFVLNVFHASDPTTAVAQGFTFQIPGEPRDIDHGVISSPGWPGPRNMIWPERDPNKFTSPMYAIPMSGSTYPPGATAPQTSVPAGGGSVPAVFSSPTSPQMLAEQARIDAEWARLEHEKARVAQVDRELAEMRHKAELAALKAEQEARMREIEAKMTLGLATAQKPTIDPLTSIIPLFQGLMAAQQAQAQQQQQMLLTVLEKKTDETPATKVFSQLSEAFGSVMKMQAEAMQQVQEILSGPKDPPGLLIVKELSKAVASFGSAAAGPKVKQLAPGKPMPAGANGAASGAVRPLRAAERGAHRQTSVDKIEALIRARLDPALVAQEFVNALEDADMVAELGRSGNDPFVMFQARLGQWATEAPENTDYVRALAPQIQAALMAVGALEEEETPKAPSAVTVDAAPVEQDDEQDDEQDEDEDEQDEEPSEGAA